MAHSVNASATEVASREAAGLEALVRDNPNLGELLAGADATRRRILADGLTEADRKLLLNAGAEPASLARLPSLLRTEPALAPLTVLTVSVAITDRPSLRRG